MEHQEQLRARREDAGLKDDPISGDKPGLTPICNRERQNPQSGDTSQRQVLRVRESRHRPKRLTRAEADGTC
jgi:hypothetical protein